MESGSLVSRLPHWAVIKDARRRQRRRLARRGFVLLVLAAIGVGLLTQRSDTGLQNRYLAAATHLGSAEIGGFGGYVLAAQASSDRLWAMTCVQLCGAGNTGLDSERLVELDAGSGAVVRRLQPLTNVEAFTIAGRDVWVAHLLSGQIARINPVTGRTVARLELRLPVPVARHDRQFLPENLTYAHGYVWASTARGWLAQIDAGTGRLVRMVRTPSEEASTTTDRQGTWVAEDLDGVGLLGPHAQRLTIHAIMQAGLPLDVYSVLGGDQVVWAVAAPDSTDVRTATIVLRINPRTGRVLGRTHVPTVESGAVVSGGALYLGALDHGRIYRVNQSGVLRTFSTQRHPAWLAASSPGALWAAATATPGQKRGRLFRIRLPRG
jgi:outer membrane protein assembly factor BamB